MRSRTVMVLLLLLGSPGAEPAVAQSTRVERAIKATRAKAVRLWTDVARLALRRHDRGAAQRSIRRVGELDDTSTDLAKLVSKLEALDDTGPDELVSARETKAATQVQAAYDRLLGMPKDDVDRVAVTPFLWLALDLDAKDETLRAHLRELASATAASGDVGACEDLRRRVPAYDPEGWDAGAYVAVEGVIGSKGILRIEAPGHAMQAFVILPRRWSADRTWPVVVFIDGASCVFETRARYLRDELGDRPYIVVVPITFSNGNTLEKAAFPYDDELVGRYRPMATRSSRFRFDAPGLTGILDRVRTRFRGEAKFFMTGYSGGGFLTYWWLHHRPEDLRAVAPASANYWEGCARGGVAEIAEPAPPVRIFTGARDEAGPPRIFPQSEEAVRVLGGLGVPIERRHLEGRDHEMFTSLVFEFFDEVRTGPDGNR